MMKVEKLTPDHIRRNQEERLGRIEKLSAEKGWPCNTLGNHDTSRIYTRYGNKLHGPELARLHAALVLTLKGTPFLYNGEEIGMTDYLLTDISQVKDTMGSWYYHTIVTEMGVHPDEAMARTAEMTRDKNRTPMQWSNSPNAGFSSRDVKTWLPINPNHKDGINVLDQDKNPSSMLHYYKHLLRIRKESPALKEGDYISLQDHAQEYLAFLRKSEEQTVLVVLNFSESTLELDFSTAKEIAGVKLRSIFSSAERRTGEITPKFKVSPFEVFIVDLGRD
jgi:alpha-glucosidase